jgi:ribosome-interacting GTPase 1
MTTEERIRQIAEQYVAQTQANVGRLRAELEEARQRVVRLEAELRGTQLAPQRLTTFQIKRDGDYQCPRCGIERGEQAAMTPRPGNPRLDLFECDTCGFEMEVQH